MAWAVGNVGAASFANNADVTPAMPTHADGEILFAVAVFRNKNAGDGQTISETGSWVQLIDELGVGLFYKLATGASETAPTFQFSGGASGDSTGAAVFTTTGGSIVPEDSDSSDNSNSTDITFPALTIATAGCLVIDISCFNNNLTFNNTAGWTRIVDAGTTAGTDIQLGVQHQTTGSDTSSHVGTASGSAGSQTVSIALRPEVIASGGLVPSGIFTGNINSGIFA